MNQPLASSMLALVATLLLAPPTRSAPGNSIDWAGRVVTYRVYLNGSPNRATVKAGDEIELRLDWSVATRHEPVPCPGCIHQFYIGFNGSDGTSATGQSVCFGNAEFYPGRVMSGQETIRFTAPSDPGIYHIGTARTWNYSCQPRVRFNTTSDRVMAEFEVLHDITPRTLSADFTGAQGCSPTKKANIREALSNAAEFFELMLEEARSADNGKMSEEYKFAFGRSPSTSSVLRCVERIVEQTVLDVESCGGAGSWGGGSQFDQRNRKFTFGPGVTVQRQRPMRTFEQSSALGTVVHEMSHAFCFNNNGTKDKLDGTDNKFRYSSENAPRYEEERQKSPQFNRLPQLADAYRLFVEGLWLEWHPHHHDEL